MLLQFSFLTSLNDSHESILVRSYTLGADTAVARDRTLIHAAAMVINNPKEGSGLVGKSLDVVPACAIHEKETEAQLAILQTSNMKPSHEIAVVLDGMRTYFEAQDNCDEAILFAHQKRAIARIYVVSGLSLAKPTVSSALQALVDCSQPG